LQVEQRISPKLPNIKMSNDFVHDFALYSPAAKGKNNINFQPLKNFLIVYLMFFKILLFYLMIL
jgi:hypothetical protein